MARVHVRIKGQVEGVELLSAKEYAQRVADAARAATARSVRDGSSFRTAVLRSQEKAKSRRHKDR